MIYPALIIYIAICPISVTGSTNAAAIMLYRVITCVISIYAIIIVANIGVAIISIVQLPSIIRIKTLQIVPVIDVVRICVVVCTCLTTRIYPCES